MGTYLDSLTQPSRDGDLPPWVPLSPGGLKENVLIKELAARAHGAGSVTCPR